MDNKNPLRHMIVWNCIATGGLFLLFLLLSASNEAGRARIFESALNFSLGALFWMVIALLAGVLGGFLMGMILWFYTYAARVTERSIIYHYLRSWLSLGLPLILIYGGLAWWYLNSGQWAHLPWTDTPYLGNVLLALLWLIVVPLVGASRFIDSLYVDVKQK